MPNERLQLDEFDAFTEINELDETLLDIYTVIGRLLEEAPEDEKKSKRYQTVRYYQSQMRILRIAVENARFALDEVATAAILWRNRTA